MSDDRRREDRHSEKWQYWRLEENRELLHEQLRVLVGDGLKPERSNQVISSEGFPKRMDRIGTRRSGSHLDGVRVEAGNVEG